MHARVSASAQRDQKSVSDSLELVDVSYLIWVLEQNSGPLPEQYILLKVVPSFHPHDFYFR